MFCKKKKKKYFDKVKKNKMSVKDVGLSFTSNQTPNSVSITRPADKSRNRELESAFSTQADRDDQSPQESWNSREKNTSRRGRPTAGRRDQKSKNEAKLNQSRRYLTNQRSSKDRTDLQKGQKSRRDNTATSSRREESDSERDRSFDNEKGRERSMDENETSYPSKRKPNHKEKNVKNTGDRWSKHKNKNATTVDRASVDRGGSVTQGRRDADEDQYNDRFEDDNSSSIKHNTAEYRRQKKEPNDSEEVDQEWIAKKQVNKQQVNKQKLNKQQSLSNSRDLSEEVNSTSDNGGSSDRDENNLATLLNPKQPSNERPILNRDQLIQALMAKTCVQISQCARVLNLEKPTRKMLKEKAATYVAENMTPKALTAVLKSQDFRQDYGFYERFTGTEDTKVVDACLNAFARLEKTVYKELKCKSTDQVKPPSFGGGENGGDCPRGYRQKEPGKGCCYKVEEVFGNQVTDEDLKQLNREEKDLVRNLFPKADPPRVSSDRQGQLLLAFAEDVQARAVKPLGDFFQTVIDEVDDKEECVDSQTWYQTISNMSWSDLLKGVNIVQLLQRGIGYVIRLLVKILYKLGKLAMIAVQKVAGAVWSAGQQFAWYILKDPLNARMILAVCTAFRDRMADKVADWCVNNGLIERIDTSGSPTDQSWSSKVFQAVRETTDLMNKGGVLDPFNMVNHLMSNDTLQSLTGKVATLSGGLMTTFASSIGPFGILASEVSKTVFQYTTNAAMESIKVHAYQTNVAESFWMLIELFDIRTAFRRHPTIYYKFPKFLKWLGGSTVDRDFPTTNKLMKMVRSRPDVEDDDKNK